MTIGQYILTRNDAGFTDDQAEALAVAHGETLAVITDAAGETLLKGLLAQDATMLHFDAPSNSWFGPWIGLVQAPGRPEPLGGWGWDTGESSTYSDWQPTQPDNAGAGEAYGIFWNFNDITGWGDVPNVVARDTGPLILSAAIEVAGRVKGLAGTAGQDDIRGGAIGNKINGLAGNDSLAGTGSKDSLYGGPGNDFLNGGAGKDVMSGGQGADTFVYNSASDSRFNTRVGLAACDVITDFVSAQGDKIDLHLIDAIPGGNHDAFQWVKTAFTGVGQLLIKTDATNTYLEGNLTGDGNPDFIIVISGHPHLTHTDFIL